LPSVNGEKQEFYHPNFAEAKNCDQSAQRTCFTCGLTYPRRIGYNVRRKGEGCPPQVYHAERWPSSEE